MKLAHSVFRSVVLLALLVPGSSGAYNIGADENFAHLALRGIRTIAVTVSGFYPDYERYGVSAAGVRNAVEQRLRSYGLEVIAPDQAVYVPGAAIMLVDLHANYGTYGYYSYATGIKIKQKIPLAAAAESFITETVWSRGTTGWVGEIEFSRVNRDIAAVLEQFLAEHHEQNLGAKESSRK